MDIYELIRGPFAFIAFTVFILGTCFRLMGFYLNGTNPKMLYPKENLKNGFKSVIVGIIPFGTRFMRARPFFTIVTVLFHFCIIILPLFLTAHIVLWFESYGLMWVNIPDGLADIMTIFVLFSCIYFLVRRLIVTEIRQVSRVPDFLLLLILFVVFLTGFLAFHQFAPYRSMLIIHIFSGEILIALIPFSRLMHMISYPFSRYYMGADFGNVLKSNDW